jgi:prephenate dehydrogenase
MDMPAVTQTTATFDNLKRMVDIVRHDSEQLFRAIENRNPFVEEVRQQFFRSATRIETRLHAQYRKDA